VLGGVQDDVERPRRQGQRGDVASMDAHRGWLRREALPSPRIIDSDPDQCVVQVDRHIVALTQPCSRVFAPPGGHRAVIEMTPVAGNVKYLLSRGDVLRRNENITIDVGPRGTARVEPLRDRRALEQAGTDMCGVKAREHIGCGRVEPQPACSLGQVSGALGGRVFHQGCIDCRGLTLRPGISVVVPVRNDAEGALALLDALAAQTRAPDEVIIVDDGSTDGTRAALEARTDSPLAFRVVDASRVGIAGARNLGISEARHEWIACTDAGCLPVPRWLEAIEQASGEADFIPGSVIVDAHTPLQRVLAISAFPQPSELGDRSRTVRIAHRLFGRALSADRTGGGYMAFRRTVWEQVGGFPLGLRSSDDRAFSTTIARAGFRIVRAPGAAVHWRPRATLLGNLAMFHKYSRGDLRVRPRRRHLIRALAYAGALAVVARGSPAERFGLASAGVAYVWLPLHRAAQSELPVRYWMWIPAVIGLKDLAQIAGTGSGLIDAARSGGRGAAMSPGSPAVPAQEQL
jgi:glycosyltransferase involved in cell wall biosynthesis